MCDSGEVVVTAVSCEEQVEDDAWLPALLNLWFPS